MIEQRCTAPGKPGHQRNPSRHKSPRGAESTREIDVFAARAWKIHTEFGIAERARQRAESCSSCRVTPTHGLRIPTLHSRTKERPNHECSTRATALLSLLRIDVTCKCR